MIASILIGGSIFAYAGWTLVRHMKKVPKECVLAALYLTIAMDRVRQKNLEEAVGGKRGSLSLQGIPFFILVQ